AERVGASLDEKDTSVSSWTLYWLVRLGVRCGKSNLANHIAAHIADEELRSRATFDPDAIDKQSDLDVLAHVGSEKATCRHCLLELARRNTRVHGSSSVSKTIDGWELELRPLGYSGIALGMQDTEK